MWDEAAIRAGLRTATIGRRLHVHEAVDSTNDLAMALGRQGHPEGTVVLADRQRRGKGRLGRGWESPPGVGIWTSILLRPAIRPAQAPLLSLVAGVAVADAIREAAELAPALKWPNDVLIRDRKAVGILTELDAEGEQLRQAVVGIGINVNQAPGDFPEEIRESATSLRMAKGTPVSRLDLLLHLYGQFEAWYLRFQGEGGAPIVAGWKERSVMLGRRVRISTDGVTWEGIASDVDADGALLVRTASGEVRRVLAGEVTLRVQG